jgi:hypothetical protein
MWIVEENLPLSALLDACVVLVGWASTLARERTAKPNTPNPRLGWKWRDGGVVRRHSLAGRAFDLRSYQPFSGHFTDEQSDRHAR